MKLLTSLTASLLLLGADALSGNVLNVRANLGADHIVNVPFSSLSESVRGLLDSFDVDEFGNTESGVDLRISPNAVAALENAGVVFDDNTEEWVEKMTKNLADPSFFEDDSINSKSTADNFYEFYRTFESIHARVDNIAAESNGLAKITTMGQSYEGRDLKVIEIGAAYSDKPTVLYFCGVHAREWLPPMFCTHMAEELVKNGGHPLLQQVRFSIVPIVNPDGYIFSYTSDNMWRKSRKPNPGYSCVGTDLNRNWDDHHCGEGASTNRCSQVYCGITPFDNVETANLKAYSESIIANGGSILSAVDVHSYGYYWMSPLGWTTQLPPAQDYNRMYQCMADARDAIQDVDGNRFTIGSSANAIYVASGGSDDWYYSGLGVIYTYTVECRGREFQPPSSNIIPSNDEIFAGMVAVTECALAIEYGGTTSNPTPLPTPNPTGYPTPYPTTDTSCVDMNPNHIVYADGSPAPCYELGPYCPAYDFVRVRCPKTCGTCANFVDLKEEELETKTIPKKKSADQSSSNSILVAVPIVVGAVVGVAAAVIILKRQRTQKEKQISSVKSEPVQQEKVVTKNPISMHDV